MTFGNYAVAIELMLKNGVSRGLGAITSEFGLLNKNIVGAHSELSKFEAKMANIRRMGALSAGITMAGVGTLSLLRGPYENAKAFEQAKVDFENLNLSASDNQLAFATAAANAHKVLGTNITENIKQITDLHTAFGDLHHALASSQAYAQYTFAAKVANHGIEVPGLANESVRALEQRGGKVINDDATFLKELKMQSQVYFGSRGKVGGKDFFAASQTGGMAYTLMDKEYLYGEFAAYMQAKSGATAGTAAMTAFSSLIGGHMDNKAKGFLADLGMLQLGVSKAQVALVNNAVGGLAIPQKEKDKLMKSMMPVTGGLKDQFLDIAAHRPDIFVDKFLVPAIREKFGMNLTDEQVGQMVTEKFNRGTSKDLGELIVNHLKFVKDANIFANAKDYSSAYQAYLKSPEGAEIAAEESWRNLSTMIGVTYIPKITKGLGSLAEGLDKFSTWTQAHPNLTKDLAYGFIGLGSAMAIGGTLSTVAFGLKGLGLAFKGISGAIGGETGLATVAGGATTTVGQLAGAIGVLGAGAFGAYLAYQKYQDATRETQDHIGHAVSSLMALFGDKDSIEALRRTDPKSPALKFGEMLNDHDKAPWYARWLLNGLVMKNAPAFDLLHPGPTRKVAPPLPSPLPKSKYSDPDAGIGELKKILESINSHLEKGMSVSVVTKVDGREIAKTLIPSTMSGPSGFNTSADRPTPGMGSLGLA